MGRVCRGEGLSWGGFVVGRVCPGKDIICQREDFSGEVLS